VIDHLRYVIERLTELTQDVSTTAVGNYLHMHEPACTPKKCNKAHPHIICYMKQSKVCNYREISLFSDNNNWQLIVITHDPYKEAIFCFTSYRPYSKLRQADFSLYFTHHCKSINLSVWQPKVIEIKLTLIHYMTNAHIIYNCPCNIHNINYISDGTSRLLPSDMYLISCMLHGQL